MTSCPHLHLSLGAKHEACSLETRNTSRLNSSSRRFISSRNNSISRHNGLYALMTLVPQQMIADCLGADRTVQTGPVRLIN